MTSFTVELIEDNGDLILPFPDEVVKNLGLEIGDTILWEVQEDGSIFLTKKVVE